MKINCGFEDTLIYNNFRNKVIESQKNKLKQGHILLSGTNATLFGNGPEMLMALSGEFDISNTKNTAKVLGTGEIACKKFGHDEKLVCARSPHITMGNLYCVTNNLSGDIWNYFDLGENIVCVNAIGENIQQRLNGCDYDSDAMLITNDKLIVETTFKQKDLFKVPVCGIKSGKSKKKTLAELDHSTSENKIGNIVNLSQKLNSILWDKLNSGEYPENVQNIYKDVCKLAVLSGIEIDKAKRAYDSVRVSKEIDIIAKKYNADAPEFFQEIVVSDSKREKKHTFYDAPMEYVYKSAKGIDYRTGKDKQKTYIAISDMLKEPETKSTSTVYDKKRKIINACEEYEQKLKLLYQDLRLADEDEKDIIYEKIRQTKEERNKQVKELLSEEYVLYLVIKDYEKEERENWHIYAPLLENELFKKMLKASKEKMPQVIQEDDGEYDLYGLKFTKIN